MKTLILSDIHSNIYALEAIWNRERDSDLVYCAGDLVDYGPYPKEVLNWIRAHQIPCVQGNHDAWVVANYRAGRKSENIPLEERAWVNHNAALLDSQDIEFLASLPKTRTFELDQIIYSISHLYQDYDEILSLFAFQEFITGHVEHINKARITRLIFGHTHLQAVRYLSDQLLWLNPGSVSYRRKNDPDQTAHYAVITDGDISLKRLSYDLAPLRKVVRQVALKESEVNAAERFFGLHTGKEGK